MNRELLVAIIGVPAETLLTFDPKFAKLVRDVNATHLLTRPLEYPAPYSAAFAQDAFAHMSNKLRERPWTRDHLLSDVNVVLLYVEREDSQIVLDTLGTQTLPVPLRMPCGRLDTPRQRLAFVNSLVKDARRAIQHGKRMLLAINEEVTNRDNKTCLLLPPKTFGKHAKNVAKLVHDAVRCRASIKEFTDGIKDIQIPRHDRYYKGDGDVVFKTPSKGGSRHGLAPGWDQGHPDSCVIASRLRFGTPYDPRFHYDCQLPKGHRRKFPGCHTIATMPRGRAYANIAPNDAVR